MHDEHTSQHMPRLVVPHSTYPSLSPSPPRTQLYNRSCSNKHTQQQVADGLLTGHTVVEQHVADDDLLSNVVSIAVLS